MFSTCIRADQIRIRAEKSTLGAKAFPTKGDSIPRGQSLKPKTYDLGEGVQRLHTQGSNRNCPPQPLLVSFDSFPWEDLKYIRFKDRVSKVLRKPTKSIGIESYETKY